MVENSEEQLPEHYLIKLEKNGRYHYVFCNLSQSFNFPVTPDATDEQSVFDQRALEDLIESQRHEAAEIAVPLPGPGGATEQWTTRASLSRQSFKGDDK